MQRNSTIGELMERKRIQDGAKEYQGHTYMDLARFDDATKHMIIIVPYLCGRNTDCPWQLRHG